MSRPLRILYEGALYHVMNQGRRGELIFLDDADRIKFLTIVKEATEEYKVVVYAYALMGNHYHLLIKTTKANISDFMREINSTYAQAFNRRYGYVGSLFRGRYKAKLIERKGYLLRVLQYIHRNPLKAGKEDDIGEYKWTSHKGYMKEEEREIWLEAEEILKLFDEDKEEAKKEYEKLINRELPEEIGKVLDSARWPSILGSYEFIKNVKRKYLDYKKRYPEQPAYRKDFVCVDEDKQKIQKMRDENVEAFKNPKKPEYAIKRRAMIYILRKEYLIKFSKIGEWMGDITYSAVSKQYKKAKEEIEKQIGCFVQVKEYLNSLNVQLTI